MSTKIEKKGRGILEAWLTEHGREYRESDRKTFDLIVDDEYAELKAGTQAFIALTGPQYRALCNGELAVVFAVNVEAETVTEHRREQLLRLKPKHYQTYEFSKARLATLDDHDVEVGSEFDHTCRGMKTPEATP